MSRNGLTDKPRNGSSERSETTFLLVLGLIAFAVIAAIAVLVDWAWASFPRVH